MFTEEPASSRWSGVRFATNGLIAYASLRAEPTLNDSHALVLSGDALIAALLGALLEIHGYTPFFPHPEESPRDALRRARPGVVLVDCEHDSACNEAFFGPATMTGARVIMYSASRSRQEVSSYSAKYGFDWFILPIDIASFSKVVRATPR